MPLSEGEAATICVNESDAADPWPTVRPLLLEASAAMSRRERARWQRRASEQHMVAVTVATLNWLALGRPSGSRVPPLRFRAGAPVTKSAAAAVQRRRRWIREAGRLATSSCPALGARSASTVRLMRT